MHDSPVINDSDEFVPMPTPDQVVSEDAADRLDPIPFQFSDIQALAARILKRAAEQGQQKIAAAQKQVAAMEQAAQDKAYKEAFPKGEQDGFAKGEKDGREAAHTEMLAELEKEREALRQNVAPAKSVLEQLAGVMNQYRQQLMAQAEGDLLLLALDIAKRLVGHELSIDPEAIRPLAVEAIGLVTDRSGITARVNPDDFKALEEYIPDLKLTFPDLGALKIEPDPSVERGGLTASTREAEVDMRLATRFATFEEAILGFSGQAAAAPWSVIPPEQVQQHAATGEATAPDEAHLLAIPEVTPEAAGAAVRQPEKSATPESSAPETPTGDQAQAQSPAPDTQASTPPPPAQTQPEGDGGEPPAQPPAAQPEGQA